MQKLSKEEMKKVMGGLQYPTVDTVYCKDGTSFAHPEGDCRCGSVGLCNNNGGFKECDAWGHTTPAQA